MKQEPDKVSVLIVDDSSIVRERLEQLLGEIAGIHLVGLANSARAALVQFHLHQPQAVILDIQMPDGSGIDVLAQIKREFPSCNVIMLTSYDEPAFRDKCAQIGADHFFHKSTEFERVVDVLTNLVERTAGCAK